MTGDQLVRYLDAVDIEIMSLVVDDLDDVDVAERVVSATAALAETLAELMAEVERTVARRR